MSYYIGFRQGWVRLLGLTIGWSDARLYPHSYGRRIRGWKVWAE